MFVFSDGNQVFGEHSQNVGNAVQGKKLLRVAGKPGNNRATLFIYARKVCQGRNLSVRLNGKRMGELSGNSKCDADYRWHMMPVAAGHLRVGRNEVILSSDSPGACGWEVGLASCSEPADSFISRDGGSTWTNRHLGRFAAMNGEYIIRLRVHDNSATAPPDLVCEQADHSQLRLIRNSLPASITDGSADAFKHLRRLSGWLAKKLVYLNAGQAHRYVPWDYWQIMQANEENQKRIRQGKPPCNIVMCVQFAVAFTQAATALGEKVRCAVSTWSIHSGYGHFFPEVWLEELGRWVVVDPTGDYVYINDDGEPVGVDVLYDNRRRLGKWVRFGPGWESHRGEKEQSHRKLVLSGKVYRNSGYWRRTDFASHPELTATAHGAITYCEPDIVWTQGDDSCIAAFPYDCRHKGR